MFSPPVSYIHHRQEPGLPWVSEIRGSTPIPFLFGVPNFPPRKTSPNASTPAWTRRAAGARPDMIFPPFQTAEFAEFRCSSILQVVRSFSATSTNRRIRPRLSSTTADDPIMTGNSSLSIALPLRFRTYSGPRPSPFGVSTYDARTTAKTTQSVSGRRTLFAAILIQGVEKPSLSLSLSFSLFLSSSLSLCLAAR